MIWVQPLVSTLNKKNTLNLCLPLSYCYLLLKSWQRLNAFSTGSFHSSQTLCVVMGGSGEDWAAKMLRFNLVRSSLNLYELVNFPKKNSRLVCSKLLYSKLEWQKYRSATSGGTCFMEAMEVKVSSVNCENFYWFVWQWAACEQHSGNARARISS